MQKHPGRRETLGRRWRCPWAVLSAAQLPGTWGLSTTHLQGSHTQTATNSICSTLGTGTASMVPLLLRILHVDGVDVSVPQARLQHVVYSCSPRSHSGFTTACPPPQHNWAAQDRAHRQHGTLHHSTSSHMHPSPSFSGWSGNKNPALWGFTGFPGAGQPLKLRSGETRLKSSPICDSSPWTRSQMPQICRSDDWREPACHAWGSLLLRASNPWGTGEDSRCCHDTHRWQSPLGSTGRGAHAHPSPLLSAGHPGQVSQPREPIPSSAHVPGPGPLGKGPACSSWLELAPFCRENRVISGAKLPIPSQNTAMLGEALYSQRQTTHICFLTVGIAPTGTERTGSLLSPSPCDCELCAEQCVANTILPGLSWALVDTWSVCPSPDQPKSPHASPARMQNVLPGSATSCSLQSCSVLSCLSEPPRWTKKAASAGGRQWLFISPSSRAGKPKLQRATGSRAVHSGYSSHGNEREQF